MPFAQFFNRSGALSKIAAVAAFVVMLTSHADFLLGQSVPAAPAVSPVSDNNQRPVPGVGHDYIHMLNDTVNPGNGTLSVRINFPVPKGRGITPPAVSTYNSGELNSLLDNGGVYVWSTAPGSIGAPANGWGVPSGSPLTGTSSTWNFTSPQSQQSEPPAPPSQFDCNFASGFSFTDLGGTQHTLSIGVQTAQNDPPAGATCPQSVVVNNPNGDTQVTGYLWPSALQSVQVGSSFSVSVIDKDGSTSSFEVGGGVNQSTPGYLEDRNGNLVGGTDTAGRPLVTGVGTPAGQYTVYGQTYTVATTTTTVNYIPASVGSVLTGYLNPECPVGGAPANSATLTVISSIGLPNGQSYKFYYGNNSGNPDQSLNNPYGLLNEIVYPDGGWVKYHWALATIPAGQPNAGQPMYTQVSSYPGTSQGFPVSNLCSEEIQTPVLIERDVNFGGATSQLATSPVQTQKFVYNTVWTGAAWTTKTTQVTTTDNILSKSFGNKYFG